MVDEVTVTVDLGGNDYSPREEIIDASDDIQDLIKNVNTDEELDEIVRLLEEIRFQTDELE